MRRIMPGAGVSIKGGKIEKVSGSLAKSQKNFSYRTEGALTLTLLGWMKNVEYLVSAQTSASSTVVSDVG